MYRIELAPGEETVFRTIEELAVGIRNGVVTQRSRIYHNASQKWLPIGLHPHYKKALEMPAASASHPPTPTPPPPPTPAPKPIAPTAPSARIAQAVQAQPTAIVTYKPLVVPEPAAEP